MNKESTETRQSDAGADFARSAAEPRIGLFREFLDFLRYEKKWWLAPIIVILLLLGLFIILIASPVGAFIYPF
jgi:hypothetical protein